MVSIIVPVYNVEKYLKRCVESLICQTYKNVEIILVDDGSTDNSSSICDFYAQMDARIKVIHKSNGGLSDARNAGIEVAKGEYLSFVDSDDYVSPDFIMLLLKACEEYNADIAQCRCISVDGDEGYTPFRESYPVSCLSGFDMIKRIYTDNGVETIVIWSKLYRRHLYDNIRFPKGKLHEDEFTDYKLFDKSNVVCLVDAELYFYRNNPNSIVRSKYKPGRLAIFAALSERMEYFAERGYDELVSQTKYAYVKQLKIHTTAIRTTPELSEKKNELKNQLKEMFPQVLKDMNISFADKKELFIFVRLPFLIKIKSIINNLNKRIRSKIKSKP
jgi:glycosyltransferase involved in cell wall biosynthesis